MLGCGGDVGGVWGVRKSIRRDVEREDVGRGVGLFRSVG